MEEVMEEDEGGNSGRSIAIGLCGGSVEGVSDRVRNDGGNNRSGSGGESD